MEYQNNNKPRFKKTERPFGFNGYYVEVRPGEDAIRAYRKIKKHMKEDKFFETEKLRSHFRKPSEIKVEKAKERRAVLRKLQRERNDSMFMGRTKRK